MGHMINRQSHAFSYNSGNNCTQKHVITYTNYAGIIGKALLIAANLLPEIGRQLTDVCTVRFGTKELRGGAHETIIRGHAHFLGHTH